jgi:integrase
MRLYQRPGSPHWWLDTTVRGHRYRVSTKEEGKREAKRAASHLVEQIELRLKKNGDVWTISQALAKWYDDHAQHLASADSIWSNLLNIERCLPCETPVSDLSSAMLMDFRAKRRGERANRSATTKKAKERAAKAEPRLVQPPTINRDLSYLQAALRHAKLIHGQPIADLPWSKIKYRENQPRNRFASQDEYASMLAATDAELADIILGAVSTGLRRGNMRWKWNQVDVRGRTVTIPRTKGRLPVIIRLAPPVVEMLKRRRAGKVPAADADVFDWTNFRRRWEALRKTLGLGDFHWHDLRHTFGTWARKAGVDLPTLKEAMAHRDIKTTMRYAHVEADEIETTFDKVAEKLAQNMAQKDDKPCKIS